MDEADHNLATRILVNLEAESQPYVMSKETMRTLGFDIRIQVIRLVGMLILLGVVKCLDPKSPASHLDQTWMADFCLIMIGFFVFINLVFIIPMAAGAPHVIFLVVRVFFGILIALYH